MASMLNFMKIYQYGRKKNVRKEEISRINEENE
jgi:hypothetical protein